MKSVAAMVAATLLVIVSSVRAETLLVDRGLPTANLNNAAGSNRSNVGWGYGAAYPAWFTGDDFTVTGDASQYRIDTLRAWFTVDKLGGGTLDQMLSGITLYGGTAPADFAALASSDLAGNSAVGPNVEVTEVTYAGGESYQGSSGSYVKLWQVEFNNLNWVVNAGQEYLFGVQGLNVVSGSGLFLHASNAALSGSPQQGSDDSYYAMYYDGTDTYSESVTSAGNGWDKASDINVQITGAAVPLPAALPAGLGLMGLVALKRRFRGRR